MTLWRRIIGLGRRISRAGNFSLVDRARHDRLRRYRSGLSIRSESVSYPPLELFISTSTACNTRCVMCPSFTGEYQGRVIRVNRAWDAPDIMPEAILETLEPLLCSAILVHPFGVGEPMLSPAFLPLLDRLGRSGAWIEFFTNGLLIDEDAAARIVAAGTRRVFFSLNAVTPEIYDEIHRGGNLDQVWNAMSRIAAARERLGATAPRTMVNFVAMEKNLAELPALIRQAAAHGVSAVEVKIMTPFANRPEMLAMQRFYQPDRDDDILRDARTAAAETGLELHLDQYLSSSASPQENAGAGSPAVSKPETPCFFPWRAMTVHPGGHVQPCCFFAAPHMLGNVNDTPAMEIWNGPAYRELRKRVAAGDYPEGCRFCRDNLQYPTRDNIEDYLF